MELDGLGLASLCRPSPDLRLELHADAGLRQAGSSRRFSARCRDDYAVTHAAADVAGNGLAGKLGADRDL